ncbi:MAG: hypothetical protein OES34_11875 [Nitrosopumilus sp.]|nr:hypothetical protein [Nitrosopumilus sp.]
MVTSCNGICNRYKMVKPKGTGRYSAGQKRCNLCDIFMRWEGLFCPCCGYRVRSKPRNRKYKEKYYEAIRKNEGVIMERS